MALPASDAFNRANEARLGGNWTCIDPGDLQLLSNTVRSAGSSDAAAYWNADAFNAYQWSECIIVSGSDGGPAVRCSSSGCYYWTPYSSGEIWRYKTGANWLKIGEANFAPGATDIIRLEVTGTTTTTLRAYLNGSLKATLTDSSSPLTSGSAGLYSVGATILDNWQGGNVYPVVPGQVNENVLLRR